MPESMCSTKTLIAIDPGASGGIAYQRDGQAVEAAPMPPTEGDVLNLLRQPCTAILTGRQNRPCSKPTWKALVAILQEEFAAVYGFLPTGVACSACTASTPRACTPLSTGFRASSGASDAELAPRPRIVQVVLVVRSNGQQAAKETQDRACFRWRSGAKSPGLLVWCGYLLLVERLARLYKVSF